MVCCPVVNYMIVNYRNFGMPGHLMPLNMLIDEDVRISSTYGWEFLQLDSRYEHSDFGLMWNSNAGNYYGYLFIESYGKEMMGARTNLTVVDYGEEIGASSTWSTGIDQYPNLGTLVSKGYDAWKG